MKRALAFILVGQVLCFAAPPELRLELVKPDVLADRLRAGSVRGGERQGLIGHFFREVGCTITEQPIDKKSANVICDLAGKTASKIVVVGAHFDYVNRGEGIVDDWSGTSMLIAIYQSLRSAAPNHSFEFVAFAGEERGLLGSRRYVRELNSETQIIPDAFINLECLGLTPPKVWLSRSTPALVGRLAAMAKTMRIPLGAVNVEKVGDDDTHPFLSKRIPVLTIHSLDQKTFPILHGPRDNIGAINLTYYYDAYRLAAFFLEYLDTQLSPGTVSSATR